jgi:hypothetical protein
MNKLTTFLTCLGLLALELCAAPAQAQIARTFVSAASGSDLNNCDRPTPCRTFQHAHDKTLANGEITVLDPGGYGAVTINRTISIINDGVGEAGVLVSGGATGILITAGASDKVSLRGLTVKGIGFGSGNGIRFSTGGSLTIENCVVRNLIDGIQLFGSGNFSVSDTLVTDNSNAGIGIQPFGSTSIRAAFNRVEIYNSGNSGLIINGGGATGIITATVSDSVAAHAGGGGSVAFAAQSVAGQATVFFMVVRSVAAYSGTGMYANGNPVSLRFGDSTVTGNGNTWQAVNGAFLRSYGDNYIAVNGDGNPAPIAISEK